MTMSARLSAAALARRWAAWTRYAAHGKDAREQDVAAIQADSLEKFARVLENNERVPMMLGEDDLTPTCPPPTELLENDE